MKLLIIGLSGEATHAGSEAAARAWRPLVLLLLSLLLLHIYIYIFFFFFGGGGEGGIKMRVGVQGLGLGYENSKRVLQGFCNQIARNRCYLWSLDPKVGTIRILGVLG